ncbi:hypothetical protein FOCC_FOCC017052 [Frankliniella occidentalis]|uniref:Uncharacterized protein LOC113213615 n=1 Tax=Frankliniella occidentalis TaxID=133901 RepID=A0A6J1T5D7_FRAOC|nr:uncharacterized protein LOC113213615 [Frankliniella occidentalis]KAE8737484.1 hypothetical protein FOCC_FOCC017052 [Frankliniella occidentalis]
MKVTVFLEVRGAHPNFCVITVIRHSPEKKAHLKKCSPEAPAARIQKKTPCLIKDCDLEFCHKVSLIDHLASHHQQDITIKPVVSKTFPSIKDFNQWKEKEEQDTFSYFTSRKGQASSTTKYFYCQRDGSAKLHSKRITSRCNKKGRIKVGHICIAKMTVRVESKAVHLEYYPTHSHACKREDIYHHPLPDAMSRFIDEKLAKKIPATVVYELTKDRFLPKNVPHIHDTKASILTKNSILIYKPYKRKLVHGPPEIDKLPNSDELFMFAFQTERQPDLMKRHCSKILVVDETHGTNQYKYQLLTVIVIDDDRRGWPVAHLITSKSDHHTLQYLFKALKSRIGEEVSVNCVITDDDPALINAMSLGFAVPLTHLLCKWHVIKNLKDNLRSKAPSELFEPIFSEIKVIMNAEEENMFLKLKAGFINKYSNNPAASVYMAYLKKHYWKKEKKWAMCYRNFPHAGVNTTGHIESFHSRLKRTYLKRKVNKRLDDLINILYDVEWDDHCRRIREATAGHKMEDQSGAQSRSD